MVAQPKLARTNLLILQLQIGDNHVCSKEVGSGGSREGSVLHHAVSRGKALSLHASVRSCSLRGPAGSQAARRLSRFLLMQNKLGGGEGIEGLYGSLTRTGMQKVLHSLTKSCGLDQTSRLVDIGAGLGRSELSCTAVCMWLTIVSQFCITALKAWSLFVPTILSTSMHLSGHVYWRPLLKRCCNSIYDALQLAGPSTCCNSTVPCCTSAHKVKRAGSLSALCLQGSLRITWASCAFASSCNTHQDTTSTHQAVHVPCSLVCTKPQGSMHT